MMHFRSRVFIHAHELKFVVIHLSAWCIIGHYCAMLSHAMYFLFVLQDKKAKKKKVQDETIDKAAVYKWVPQRKR